MRSNVCHNKARIIYSISVHTQRRLYKTSAQCPIRSVISTIGYEARRLSGCSILIGWCKRTDVYLCNIKVQISVPCTWIDRLSSVIRSVTPNNKGHLEIDVHALSLLPHTCMIRVCYEAVCPVTLRQPIQGQVIDIECSSIPAWDAFCRASTTIFL